MKDIVRLGIYDFEADRADSFIIDAGAHVGLATMRFKQLHPDAHVVCFEPDPPAFECLVENVRACGLHDVECVQAGLAGFAGAASFSADGADGGRLASGGGATHMVRTVMLSDYLRGPVDFVKLNIEGQELAVLREAERANALGWIGQLAVEYHGWPEGPQHLGEILSLLDRNGFRYVVHDFDGRTSPVSKPPYRRLPTRPWFALVRAWRPEAIELTATAVTDDGGGGPLAPRCAPISRVFGFDRGTPVDRHYIARFLEGHRRCVRGRVLEVGDDAYSRGFGGGEVTDVQVLHVHPGAGGATIIGDLESGRGVPTNSFDCIIVTQTLHVIYDVRAAVKNLYAALRPGGTVLATVPGISQISRYDMDRWGDYWRFTRLSVRRVFEESFPVACVKVSPYGNCVSATAFLQGLAAEELHRRELDVRDPDYELLIGVRATKPHA